MAKILLVEDDNNLREIYGERLMAEGYDIVSASDGEEALQTAVTEKPDLIISDVMMPKISGFDMLDILRQTPETKNVKIIMMTALSQAEDKTRADNLGADKYLVKSQVTLEDVARVVHDILEDGPAPEITTPAPETQNAASTAPVFDATSVTNMPEPVATPVEVPNTVIEPTAPEAAPMAEPVVVAPVIEQPVAIEPTPAVQAEPVAPIAEPVPAEPIAPQPAPVVTPTEPVAVPPPVAEPVLPMAEPVIPVAMPTVEPTAPEAAVPMNAPVSNPISEDTTATPSVVNPTPVAAAPVDDTMAQTAQVEIDEVAKQIESFVAENGLVSEHQEPVNEPTEQDLIHAQNAAEEPKVVAAQPATPVNPTVPPLAGVNTANPEPTSSRKKIISPMNGEGFATPDIHALYEQEMAKEAADSPVINPTIVESPVDNNDPTNPIAGTAPEQEVAPPPLETIDASQISGVHYGDDDEYAEAQVEAEAAAALQQAQVAQQMPAQTPQISQTQSGIPPAPEEPAADPNDPNNFAL